VPYFSTSKLFWTYGGGYPFPYNSFWWEGIDGSRVFAHLHHDYNNRTDPATMIARWERQPQEDGSSARMVAYGWGDGGGGPTREHLEYLQRQQDLEGAPRLRHSHPLDFFRDEKKREDDMPTYVGELYLQCHRGTYTTQARTKKGNRRSEFALRDAELWAATAAALTGHAYPQAQLRATWQQVLLNQFHDIIPGSSIERVHLEAEAGYAQAVKDARAVADRAARSFLGQDRETVTVFNSLSWPRDALVTLPEGFKGAVTGDGKTLPSQPAAAAAAADGATVVRVRDIPSCGWCVLRKGGPGRAENPLGVSPARLENEHLRIKINALGELVSVYDKDAGQELAAGPCNRFLMFKDVPNAYDAWDIDRTYRECPVPLAGKARITVKARGPLVAVLQVERRLHDSMLKQEIRLAAGSRRVDFVTRIDWQERHKLLKVAFPVDVRAEQAIHEIQFGHLSRPTHASNEFDAHRFEVCQQKWTALSENAHGVAVLNDCKYGISVDGNTMKLTLLKRSLAPDMHADRGLQTFRYALYAWNGSFADSGVVREAYELNVPVTLQAGDGGGEASLFGVDRANVIIETVKAAEDGSGDVIVRLYEAKRMRTRCTLSTALPVSRAQITNMLEEQGKTVACRRGRIRLSFRPFEIKTVRLRMQAAGAPGA
jgi:alpha-mannosidase